MSDHGTDHGTFSACTPTNRSQRSRHLEIYAQNTDHGTDHADHAQSDHAPPLLSLEEGVRSWPLNPTQAREKRPMSTTTTATIETLTAEVRTLVLGSRQVTLSVAKQLDVIPLSRLTIFGRVHIFKDRDYVIGADVDGTLALAEYTSGPMFFAHPFITAEDLEGGRIVVCANMMKTRDDRSYRLRLDETIFEIADDAAQLCGVEGHHLGSREGCGNWCAHGTLDLIGRAVQSQLASHADVKALNEAAVDSPLIVLAGLR